MEIIYLATTWVIPLLLCIVVHESAHAWAAYRLGDRTAYSLGRLNLNPLHHIDLVGTIVVPLILILSGSKILFGWAKPVPIDYRNLKKPKRDMGLIAAAGPLSNILLAIIFVLIGRILWYVLPQNAHITMWTMENLRNGIVFSLVLAAVNLIPILPLDGGRIVASILPVRYSMAYQRTEQYGMFIFLALAFVLPLVGIDIIGWFLGTLYPFFVGLISLFF